MSLRTLFILLIALNLVIFVGGRMGWLGSSAPRGEPERLTNQLNAGEIVLGAVNVASPDTPPAPPASEPVDVTPAETPPAPEETPATPRPEPTTPSPAEAERCMAFAFQGNTRANEAETLARGFGSELRVARRTLEEPAHWRVRIPPARSIDVAEQRVRDLRAQGIADLFLIRNDGADRGSISLGLYSTENSARQRLTSLRSQGVTNAEVLPGSAGRYEIEVRGAASALDQLATRMQSAPGSSARQTCTP